MPAHWKEWEKAKREIKQDKIARASAVDEALGILSSNQKVLKDDPNAVRCTTCGGMKFKTREKGRVFVCRNCGTVMERGARVDGPTAS